MCALDMLFEQARLNTFSNSSPHPKQRYTSPNPRTLADLIREELFVYAKNNLALVNVYIKDPVVTRIKRDQKIPLIGFVANTGGLLGLCMGFSLVSVAEIIYHALVNVCHGCRGGVRRVQTYKQKRRWV
jgi:hypothetical protein